jgi:hypothetical protein
VVSDLVRKRPIRFGGKDRSEASMAAFYDWLGPKKSRKIELAMMDMWKPFRNATRAFYDKVDHFRSGCAGHLEPSRLRFCGQLKIVSPRANRRAMHGGTFDCLTNKG